MNGRRVQGDQDGNIYTKNDRVDIYVDALCHFECAIENVWHVQFLRVLTHTPLHFHSVSHRMHIQIDVVGI
jgi:hypothetical protein